MGVPLIAAAVMAAGTAAKMYADKRSQDAMNSAVQTELNRQKGYQQRATSEYQSSLSQSTPQAVNQQLAAGEQRARAAYSAAQTPMVQPVPQMAFPGGSQQVTTSAADAATIAASNARAARLAGYNEFDLQQAIKDMQARNVLGAIGTESAASERVLPYEIQHASQRGAPFAMLGSLLSAGGSMGLTSSMMGSNATAASTGMTPSITTVNSTQPALAGSQRLAIQRGYGPVSVEYANYLQRAGLL